MDSLFFRGLREKDVILLKSIGGKYYKSKIYMKACEVTKTNFKLARLNASYTDTRCFEDIRLSIKENTKDFAIMACSFEKETQNI